MIIRLLNAAPRWVRRSVTAMTRGKGPLGRLYDVLVHRLPDESLVTLPEHGVNPVRVLIGPANSAGQGYEWARAIEAAHTRMTDQVDHQFSSIWRSKTGKENGCC